MFWVLDTHNYHLHKFTPDGKFLGVWGNHGSGPGQFADPTGIAIDKENRIYVADSANKRVQVFDSSFRHLFSYWYDNKWQGEIFSPTDVAVDSGFYVFTADFFPSSYSEI